MSDRTWPCCVAACTSPPTPTRALALPASLHPWQLATVDRDVWVTDDVTAQVVSLASATKCLARRQLTLTRSSTTCAPCKRH